VGIGPGLCRRQRPLHRKRSHLCSDALNAELGSLNPDRRESSGSIRDYIGTTFGIPSGGNSEHAQKKSNSRWHVRRRSPMARDTTKICVMDCQWPALDVYLVWSAKGALLGFRSGAVFLPRRFHREASMPLRRNSHRQEEYAPAMHSTSCLGFIHYHAPSSRDQRETS
jgi:hypothetical protein